MPTTKKKIAEQVQRNYARFLDQGNIEGTGSSVDERELYLYIEQAINQLLKVENIQRFQDGNIDIVEQSIATYEAIDVVATNNRASAVLPATPISLPMGMGVWQITNTDNPFRPYIPLSAADLNVANISFNNTYTTQEGGLNASYLEGQVGYVVNGKKVYFTRNIVADGVTTVDIQLIIHDIANYNENELLPLNSDLEASVIKMVMQNIMMGVGSQQELNSKDDNPNR